MAEQWQVNSVASIQVGETPCWHVELKRPDGQLVNHIMPKSIFDHKAAELGIDPTDVDTMLDIILHEQHVPMVDDPVTGQRTYAEGVTVMSAESTTQAREAHQARLKNASVKISVKNNKALDKIRSEHTPDPTKILALKEHIDTHRWILRHGSLPVEVDTTKKPAAKKMAEAMGITITLPDLRQE